MASSLRVDPGQRFACAQCGRCCRGFDVVVTVAEVERYRRRDALAWFRSADGAEVDDAFEAVPGAPGMLRIRKRGDGACGFLSPGNRCRIHEELGAAQKPLTCRLFPYSFHAAEEGVVAKASFNCPTIVANEGLPINAGPSLVSLESLRKEWFAEHPPKAARLALISGRPMTARSLVIIRKSFLAMLASDGHDLRAGLRRMAAVLDDLTRSRVCALGDDEFAEYISLTVPHAAAKKEPPAPANAGAISRLLQYGFLYAVVATRDDIANPGQSRNRSRARRLRLLAHFHGLAPGLDNVNVKALEVRVDVNGDECHPVAFHYLRSTIETLGSDGRPIIDELSMAVSYLNAACALAAMNAAARGIKVDRAMFIRALTEASDVSHARHKLLDTILAHFSGGTNALRTL